MNLIFKIVAFVFIILELNSIKLVHAKSKVEKCKLCTDLVENFIKGLKKTSKGNFGGGNTGKFDLITIRQQCLSFYRGINLRLGRSKIRKLFI
jgi:hypothetical protein